MKDEEIFYDVKMHKIKFYGRYLVIIYKRKTIPVQNIIWEKNNTKIPKGMVIDHINHNKLDNRIENLRLVTPNENCKNKSIGSRNISGIMGVSWCKQTSKWSSSIVVNGRQKDKKRFQDKEEAILYRRMLEVKYDFHINHNKSSEKAGEKVIALSVKQLQAKKQKLVDSITTIQTATDSKIAKVQEEIIKVDENLNEQVATLQAQIDAIKGINADIGINTDDVLEETEEEELV